MAQFDSKVEGYITQSADFAIPILEHWRALVHHACPGVAEALKWSIPHFDYKGDFMCVMASYKSHCSFTFIKAPLMIDPRLKSSKDQKPIQRFLGKITQLSDLPPDEEFITMLKEAMELNEKGIKLEIPKSDKPRVIEIPDYFSERLAANARAKEVFDTKSDSFRKDYIVWISDAKSEATREKRMAEALEWIEEGKGRFWKYQK